METLGTWQRTGAAQLSAAVAGETAPGLRDFRADWASCLRSHGRRDRSGHAEAVEESVSHRTSLQGGSAEAVTTGVAKRCRWIAFECSWQIASLAHVLALLPDVIKLDMSLTRGIDQDRNRRALASAMISFASDLGAIIVAEGIETREELASLRSLGVRYGQDFYLAPPRRLLRGADPARAFDQTLVSGF